MKSTRLIDIYLTKKSNVRTIDVVQYDSGINLVFNVKDFDIPSGAVAKLYVQKPSGKFVFQETGINIVDNTILISLENQAITEHGKVPYQVSITNGSDMITTFTGLMMVEKSLKDSSAIESKTVIRAFDEVVSDHVAEFQAKAEQIVQACIATIPEDYTAMEAKVNEQASAIKGEKSGAVVRADDVSTVEHCPVVRVHGKNLFHSIIDKTGLLSGISHAISKNTSTVILSGVATQENALQLPDSFSLRKGTYTVSVIGLNESDRIYLRNQTKGEVIVNHIKPSTPRTFTLGVDADIRTYLVFKENSTYDNTSVHIQIEQGDTATDYEPYIDPSTVTVKRVSKNLIDCELMKSESTLNGVTITRDGDQLTLNGTLTVDSVLFNTHFCHHGGLGNHYTLSYKYMGGTVTGTASVCVGDSETVDSARQSWGNIKMLNSDNSFVYAMTKPFIKDLWFYAMAGVVFTNYKIKIQLEPGKEATDFEACNGAEYTPAADGAVSGVTSLSPFMTLLTDTEGVIVECEYNMDTKTYIDRKIKELMEGVKA